MQKPLIDILTNTQKQTINYDKVNEYYTNLINNGPTLFIDEDDKDEYLINMLDKYNEDTYDVLLNYDSYYYTDKDAINYLLSLEKYIYYIKENIKYK